MRLCALHNHLGYHPTSSQYIDSAMFQYPEGGRHSAAWPWRSVSAADTLTTLEQLTA